MDPTARNRLSGAEHRVGEGAEDDPRPVIVAVEDEPIIAALTEDLNRRFQHDFRVIAERELADAIALLDSLASAQVPVALVIAGDQVAGEPGVDFLIQAQLQHPIAKRALMVERDYTPTNPVVRAMMLGQIDYHLSKPWRRERTLYPAVGAFLAAWSAAQDSPGGGVFRVIGEQRDTASIRDLLVRTGMPYVAESADSEVARRWTERLGQDAKLPLVIRYDGEAMVDPSHAELLEALGMKTRLGSDTCDVVVLGAGPAGLAAGVYAASEGLETIVLEPEATGGQAGTSSMIRNYLGFAHGVSGQDFAVEACEQAWLFGADLVLGQAAEGLRADGPDRIVRISDGSEIRAKAVVISTGVSWRRLGVPSLEALVGSGVFYGAAGSEARAMAGQDVFLIGAGNSAGQAALHLAKHAATVTILARGDSLEANMSQYLINEIAEARNCAVRCGVEVVEGLGASALEALVIRDRASGSTETHPAAALFILIGAEPHTTWLPESIARDEGGFLSTGRDLSHGDGQAEWSCDRPPLMLECAVPGVFAAGDVRSGSVKRVASAVGEGATAVQMLHEYFRDEQGSAAVGVI